MHRLAPPEAESYSDAYSRPPEYEDVTAAVREHLERLAAEGVADADRPEPLAEAPSPLEDVFEVAVVGHLREVKAPMLTAEASRRAI